MSNALVRLSALAALGIGSLMAGGPALAEGMCESYASKVIASQPAATPVPATTASTVPTTPSGS